MTCAKKKVRCFIVTEDAKNIFYGTNHCDTPVMVCPRTEGEGYEKCKSICNQKGHAEEMALAEAEGFDLTGATAYIEGIGHYCKSCQIKLFAAGVENLRLVK
jgi:deoxycytidylate deaminase